MRRIVETFGSFGQGELQKLLASRDASRGVYTKPTQVLEPTKTEITATFVSAPPIPPLPVEKRPAPPPKKSIVKPILYAGGAATLLALLLF